MIPRILTVLSLLLGPAVQAASITWGAATTISGDTDVSTSGTLVYAYNDQNAAATVNTVAFAAGNSSTAFGANVTMSGFSGSVASTFGASGTPWNGLSSSYQTVLNGAAYGSTAAATITLNNLTVGHSYLVQVWVNDSRTAGIGRNETSTSTGGNTVTLTYNSTGAQGGVGQYTIGSFTADATTQAFTMQGNSGSGSSQLNAIQVRDQPLVTKLNTTTTMNNGASDWSSASTTTTVGEFNSVPSLANMATMTLGGNLTLGGLQLDNNTTGPLTISAANTLTLGAAGINMAVANNSATLNCAVTLGSAQNWTVASGKTLTIGGVLSGAYALTTAGAGTVQLNGANSSFSGPVTVTAGTLYGSSGTSLNTFPMLGTGQINLNAGTLNLRANGSGNSQTIITGNGTTGNNVVVGGNVTIQVNRGSAGTGNTFQFNTLGIGANTLTMPSGNSYNLQFAGATTLSGNATFVPQNGTLTLSGAVGGGAYGITMNSSSGILTLAGANTYTGATTVSAGTLLVNSPGSLAAGSAVTVASGATLGGNGTINGTVNVSAGGILAPGGIGTIGTLTLASASASTLTLNGNTLLFDLPSTGTTCDSINFTGTGKLVVNGVNYIALNFPNGAAQAGTYTLLNYPAGYTGSGSIVLIGTYPNATLNFGATSVTLTVAPSTTTYGLTWKGPSSSTVWDTTTANWLKGASASTYNAGDDVTFDDTASTFTVTGSGSPSSVLFNNSANAYTVSAAIGGTGPVVKLGAGTTTLSGVNSYSGGTTINAGTLTVGGAGQLGSGSYAGTIANNGTFTYNSSAAQTLSGAISGAGTLTQQGAGTLTLSGANTYTGATTLSGGMLQLQNATSLPGTAVTMSSGTTLQLRANSGATFAPASLGFTSGGTVTYNFDVNNITSGTGNTLILANVGQFGPGGTTDTFNLTGGNNYTLQIGSGSAGAGALSIWNNSTINSSTAGVTLSIPGGISVNYNTSYTLALGGAGNISVGALTRNGANNLPPTFGGSGTITLNGANNFGAAAGTISSTGTLALNNNGALTGLSTLALNSAVTLDNTSGGAVTISATPAQTWSSDFTFGSANTTGPLNLGTGTVTLGATRNVTVASSNYGLTVGGVINGATYGLTKLGSGTLALSGINTYGGATTINNGRLVGVSGSSSASSAVTVQSSGPGNTAALGELYTGANAQWTCSSLTTSAGVSGGNGPVLEFAFNTTPSATAAPLKVTGTATFNVTPTVRVDLGNLSGLSGTIPLMTVGGTAPALPTLVIVGGYSGSTLAWSGNTLNLTLSGTSTPIKWATSTSGTWDINNSGNTVWKDATPTATYYQEPLGPYGDQVVFDETYITAGTAITLNSVVNPGSVSVNNPAYNYTISGSGAIAGSGSLTKSGAATLTLGTTNNTYPGGTTVSAGTLKVGVPNAIPGNTVAGDVSVSGTLDLNTFSDIINGLNGSGTVDTVAGGTPTLTVGANGDSGSFSGVIRNTAGTLKLTKAGSGTQTLGNANTYSGVTTVSAGTLQLQNLGAIANSALQYASGSTLNLRSDASGTFQTTGATVSANANPFTWNISVNNINNGNNGNTLILPNVGQLMGANAFSGSTLNVSGGNGYTLQMGANPAGTSAMNFWNSVTLNSSTAGVTLSMPGGLSCNYSPATFSMVLTGAGNISIGPIVTTGTSTLPLTLAGSGTITLTGANNFGTTSGTVSSTGTLALNNNGALTGLSTLALNSAVTLDNTSGGAVTISATPAQTWSSDFTFGSANTTGPLNLGTGTVTLGATRTVNVANSTYGLTVGGVISGTSLGINKSGPGNLTLSGVNTFSGAITINAGTLTISGAGRLGSGTYAANITDNGTFTYASSVAQTLNGQISGSGGITQQGSGTLTLAPASGNNSYSGPTAVNAGKLVVQSSQTGTGNFTVADGADLAVTVSSTSQLQPSTLSLGTTTSATLEFNNVTNTSVAPINAGTFSSAGTLTIKINSGTFTAGQTYPLVTWTTGSAPTASLSSMLALGVTAHLVSTGTSLSLAVDTVSDIWTGSSSGIWDAVATGNWTGLHTIYADGDAVVFDDTATGTTNVIINQVVQPSGIVFNNSAKNYTLTAAANKLIGGNAGLTKAGNGTLTLSGGANTNTGATTITGGLVSVGTLANGGVASDIGSSANAAANLVLSGGTLQYTGAATSSDRLFTIGTSGATLDASGSGALNLNNTGSAGLSGSGARSFTLTGTNTGANILAAVIGDNGGATALNKSGAGSWTLSGANSYSGATTLSAGTLALTGSGTLGNGSSALTVGGGTLDLGGLTTPAVGAVSLTGAGTIQNGSLTGTSYSDTHSTGTATISAGLLGSGGLNVSGGGTLALSGPNAFSGALVITNGTVNLLNNQSGVTGGFLVSTNSSYGCALNIGSATQTASTVATVASGQMVQVGNAAGGGTGYSTISVNGAGSFATTVTNNGTLWCGRDSGFTIAANGNWFQFGDMMIQEIGGYVANYTISSGGTFTYAGVNPINATVTGSANDNMSISGTFTTGQGFNFNNNGTGYPALTLNSGGTLALSANIPLLITNTGTGAAGQLLLGTGGGVINTAGFNTAISLGIGNASGQTGALNKSGLGTLTLSGTNTYTGATTVSAGTLTIDTTGVIGGGASGSVITVNGGTLTDNSAVTTSGGIAGTSSLTISSGAAILNTANNYSGATSVTGTLLAADPNAFKNSAMTLNNGATLQLRNNSANAFNSSGAVLDSGVPNASINIDVNNNGSGTANTLTLANGFSSTQPVSGNTAATYTTTINITGGNGYSLVLPAVTYSCAASYGSGGTRAYVAYFSPTSANVSLGNVSLNGTGSRIGLSLTLGGTSVGNLVTGAISSSAGQNRSVTKNGTGTWTLAGTNTYTGATTISAGTLALSGSGLLASPTIAVAGGATFDVSGLSSAFTLGSTQTLSDSNPSAVLAGNLGSGSGTLALAFAAGTPALVVTNGTLTLSASTVVTITNTGSTLAPGSYKIITKATAGNVGMVAGSLPASVFVTGGQPAAGTPTLSIVNGELYLNVGGNSVWSYGGTAFTYDGTAKTPTISLSGSTSAATTNYMGIGSTSYGPSQYAPTNAGTYLVTNAVAGDTNYNAGVGGTNFTINQATPVILLTSSANPAGFHDALTFVATNFPTDATSNVIFSANGVVVGTNNLAAGGATSQSITNLPRGITNIITAFYTGDNNYFSVTTNLTQVVTNHPPTANDNAYTRGSVYTWRIAVSNLLTNSTDVDGDQLTLASVATSTNGIGLVVSGNLLQYYNTNLVNDQFTYYVTDGYGGTNSATVTLTVNSSPLFGQSQIASIVAGTATLTFAGIPNYSYSILRSTNVDFSPYDLIWTTNAPANGLFNFTDTNAPSSSAFYRLQYNP